MGWGFRVHAQRIVGDRLAAAVGLWLVGGVWSKSEDDGACGGCGLVQEGGKRS